MHGSAATATGGEAPLPLVAKVVPVRGASLCWQLNAVAFCLPAEGVSSDEEGPGQMMARSARTKLD